MSLIDVSLPTSVINCFPREREARLPTVSTGTLSLPFTMESHNLSKSSLRTFRHSSQVRLLTLSIEHFLPAGGDAVNRAVTPTRGS